jgi:glyoxylase-like metal-dependent hydrolase (beta-lactamase superfamily II)
VKLGNPIEIVPGVHQIRAIGARVTVLSDGDNAVLVDAGSRGSRGPISSGLDALGIALERVGLVVLTHYHPDHSGGLSRLVLATPAKVATHRLEAGIVSGEEPPPSPYRSGLIATLTRPVIGPLYGAPVDVDYTLEDGDRLPFDLEVRVVHTPGHTSGSICLYVPSKKLVIVGDALQYRRRRLGPPASSVTQDIDQAMESLKKLLPLDIETICFSHFPPLRLDAQASLRRLVEKQTAA